MKHSLRLSTFSPLLLAGLVAACNGSNSPDKPSFTGKIGSVKTLDFTAFNSQEAALEEKGFRVFGPNADLAKDVEPEYITVSKDSKTAWVSLQENNGLARVDLSSGKITQIFPLGFKNYSTEGNEINASDKDDGNMTLRTFPNLKSMYQPDGIASFEDKGVTYIITANEGDGREYDGFEEESRVGKLTLDETAFPNAAELQADSVLGRLKVTKNLNSSTAASSFETLYSFGARSFSIWNGDTGALVYDSGKDLAVRTISAGVYPDKRSDDKGTEPENVAVGTVAGKRLVFVGLERANAVAVYDISDLTKVAFKELLVTADDIGPEGILFIPASDSPNNADLLVVSNEVSATVTVYQANAQGKFGDSVGRVTLSGGEGAAEISAYHKDSKKLFVVNNGEDLGKSRVEVIDLSNPAKLAVSGTLDTSKHGAGINSVAVSGNLLAVALEAANKTDNGTIALYNASSLGFLDKAEVGALPDMVTFSKDGKTIISANEGEPNKDYSIDPKGSVSIIKLK